MSLDYQPEHIRAIYAMFRKLPPFDGWNLPQASKVEFIVDDDDEIAGELTVDPVVMRISLAHQSHFDNVCKTVLHEMIHLHLAQIGKVNFDRHDKAFQKLRTKIAMMYNYDPKEL